MLDGSFTAGSDSTKFLTLGASESTNPNEARFIQKGGDVITTGVNLQLDSGGSYQISGGKLNLGGYLYFAYADAGASLGGTFRVIGSKATEITIAGGLRYYNQNDRDKATWGFTLDNGEDHITKVFFAANGNAGGNLRAGTLDVGLSGGVLLSGTNTFTLFEAPTILTTTNFVNAADYEGATAKLWVQGIVDGPSTDLLQISFNGDKNQGTLNASINEAISFAPVSYGYVSLVNVNLDGPLVLALDVTGGDLVNFTNALTTAGILWGEGSGDYEVNLFLDPAVSGGGYFAWDFAGIDGAMALQGVMVVPEPATGVLMIGGLGMLFLLRRRSGR